MLVSQQTEMVYVDAFQVSEEKLKKGYAGKGLSARIWTRRGFPLGEIPEGGSGLELFSFKQKNILHCMSSFGWVYADFFVGL